MIKIYVFLPSRNYTKILFANIDLLTEFTSDTLELNIAISDDSDDEDISKEIEKYATKFSNVHYTKGPKKGAVYNWNSFYNKHKGEYYWYLHHDELITISTLHEIDELLKQNNQPDLIFLRCKLKKNNSIFMHSFSEIITLILNHPKYLFLINPFGSPSCCIFHNSLAFNYDANLKLLVDVDLFYRQLSAANDVHISVSDNLSVLSDLNFQDTETKRFNLNLLKQDELNYIGEKYAVSFTRIEKTGVLLLRMYLKLRKFVNKARYDIGIT